jgi:hypothetical protein
MNKENQHSKMVTNIRPDHCQPNQQTELRKIFGKSSYDSEQCANYFRRLSEYITELFGPHTKETF